MTSKNCVSKRDWVFFALEINDESKMKLLVGLGFETDVPSEQETKLCSPSFAINISSYEPHISRETTLCETV